MKIESERGMKIAAGVMILVLAFVMVRAIVSQKISEDTVQVVAKKIARQEKIPAGASAVSVTLFEHRDGSKGTNVHAQYTLPNEPSQTRDRYYLLRRPLIGSWYISREIDQPEWDASPGGPPVRFR